MAKVIHSENIFQLETGLLANRPSLESVNDGSWVWRFSNGFTRRANSLQSLERSDDADFENRLNIHWQRSRQKNIDPVFRVTPLTPPGIVEFLLENGFERQGNTKIMALDTSLVPEAGPQINMEHLRIVACPVTDPQWQKRILRLENISEKDAGTFIQMLGKLPQFSIGLTLVQDDGAVIGVAYASCKNRLGSVFALEVNPDQRGKGYGRVLMNYLNVWLKEHGAVQVVLQVVAGNQAALGLYSSLGFEEVYRYYYLVEKK
ncbi:MAG: GNAT family N-acetyltransferase [Devosiaceae bacterium]|nr:GNAT family N-acetyltransferase [Devosiaceae bacterium]